MRSPVVASAAGGESALASRQNVVAATGPLRYGRDRTLYYECTTVDSDWADEDKDGDYNDGEPWRPQGRKTIRKELLATAARYRRSGTSFAAHACLSLCSLPLQLLVHTKRYCLSFCI